MFVTISHQKGGVGKSTISWNLAIELSKHFPVNVIDLDIQKTFTQSYKVRSKLLSDSKAKDVRKSFKNLSLFSNINNEEELVSFVEKTDKNKIHIIDTGGYDQSLNRVAMAMSSILVTPVSSKFYELLGLKKYEEILEVLSDIMGRKIIASVVFNKINPLTRQLDDIYDFVENSPYFAKFDSVLRQRVDFENSPGKGMTVSEYNKDGKASDEIIGFINEVLELVYEHQRDVAVGQ